MLKTFLISTAFAMTFSVAAVDDKTTETDTSASTEISTEANTSADTDGSMKMPELTDLQNPSVDISNMTVNDFMTTIDKEGDKYGTVDNDQVFQMMKNSLDAGESIPLGKAFALSEGLTIPENFVYDLSETGLNGKLDASTVNYEYASLVAEMNKTEKQMNKDLSKNVKDANSLFLSTYGDPLKTQKGTIDAGYTLPTMELPEGVTYGSLCSDAKSKVNSQFSSMKADSNFKQISNKFKLSNLYSTALSATDKKLKTTDELQERLDQSSGRLQPSEEFIAFQKKLNEPLPDKLISDEPETDESGKRVIDGSKLNRETEMLKKDVDYIYFKHNIKVYGSSEVLMRDPVSESELNDEEKAELQRAFQRYPNAAQKIVNDVEDAAGKLYESFPKSTGKDNAQQ